jgi:hypothetical protein
MPVDDDDNVPPRFRWVSKCLSTWALTRAQLGPISPAYDAAHLSLFRGLSEWGRRGDELHLSAVEVSRWEGRFPPASTHAEGPRALPAIRVSLGMNTPSAPLAHNLKCLRARARQPRSQEEVIMLVLKENGDGLEGAEGRGLWVIIHDLHVHHTQQLPPSPAPLAPQRRPEGVGTPIYVVHAYFLPAFPPPSLFLPLPAPPAFSRPVPPSSCLLRALFLSRAAPWLTFDEMKATTATRLLPSLVVIGVTACRSSR